MVATTASVKPEATEAGCKYITSGTQKKIATKNCVIANIIQASEDL